MPSLRIGVIGTGWIGQTHIETLRNCPDVAVSATADPAPGRATYADWRAMLDRESLDAVIIATPPDTHREPALAAAARGLPFYLEKPVAHTLDDAAAVRVGADRVIAAVGYQYRAISFLDELPDDPLVLIGTGVSLTRARVWFGDATRGGSIFLERASHLIDLQRRLAGEVEAVAASGGEAGAAITLRFVSGAVGSVTVGNLSGPGWFLDLAGHWEPVRLELGPRYLAGSLHHEGRTPVERSLCSFIDAVRYDDPDRVLCPLAEGVRTLAVSLEAEASAAAGGWADLADSASRSSAASAAGSVSGTGTPSC